MAWYDLFVGKRGNITDNSSQSDTIEDLNTIKENTTDDIIREVKIIEDGRVGSFFDGSIESIHSKQSINEGKVNLSPSNLPSFKRCAISASLNNAPAKYSFIDKSSFVVI